MKTYTYKFVDGTKSAVEVTDEIHALLVQMDKEEKYGNRSETRRHISLDELNELGIAPMVFDDYDYGEVLPKMQDEALAEAVKSLDAAQKKLLYAVFYERRKLKEIAEEEKVSPQLISWRLQIALSQLRQNR